MSFLKDVKVNKVSFVRKAANKRKFLLLKSEDCIDENNINEEYKPMRKEVKEALIKCLNIEENLSKDASAIIDIVKADATLNVVEAEITEITEYVNFAKAFGKKDEKGEKTGDKLNNEESDNDEDDEEKMKKEEQDNLIKTVENLQKSLEAANATINSITKDTQRRDILSFLAKECAFAPGDVQKHADTIMELTKAAPSAADEYKNTLKIASANIEQSNLLKEVGNSTDELLKAESDGFDLIKKFDASFSEIKKGANGATPDANSIVNLVKSFGRQYNDYREAHILRAKRNAI